MVIDVGEVLDVNANVDGGECFVWERVSGKCWKKHVFCVKYWSKMNPIMWGGLAGSQQELCK